MEQSNQLIYKTDDIWQHKMSIDKIHVCKSGDNRRNVDDSPQTDRDREQNHASVFARNVSRLDTIHNLIRWTQKMAVLRK